MPKTTKRPDKRLERRISVTDPLTGKRHQPRVYGRTASELRDAEVEVRSKILKGDYLEPERMPLVTWCWEWYARYRESDASRAVRRYDIRRIERDSVAHIALGHLKRAHLQAFVDRLSDHYAPRTVRSSVTALRMALQHAVRVGIIPSDPSVDLDLPSQRPQSFPIWSEDEVRRFIAGVQQRDDLAFWVLPVTFGLRLGELLALRWSDVDWERGTLTIQRTMTVDEHRRRVVGETGKSRAATRTIPLGTLGTDVLRTQRTRQLERRLALGEMWVDSGAIFDGGDGRHQRSTSPSWRTFQRIMAELQLPRIRFHDLRHTAASHMLRRGVPVPTVARILGHSNPSITMRTYAHVLDEMLSDASATIDRLYGS